jgi:hypothetical protein
MCAPALEAKAGVNKETFIASNSCDYAAQIALLDAVLW